MTESTLHFFTWPALAFAVIYMTMAILGWYPPQPWEDITVLSYAIFCAFASMNCLVIHDWTPGVLYALYAFITIWGWWNDDDNRKRRRKWRKKLSESVTRVGDKLKVIRPQPQGG